MPKQIYTASEAARALGISLDTLRRWDREGLITTTRDRSNRRQVSGEEIERLRGARGSGGLSARNRLRGVVGDVKTDGLLAQVEIQVNEPATVIAIVTRESAEALGLKPGVPATAVVKATSVMVER
ncbi:MAG: TOBE domain-containing protein [Gaiellaceae bacterium]